MKLITYAQQNYRIFSIDELSKLSVDREEEIESYYDEYSYSDFEEDVYVSLIVYMFNFCGYSLDEESVIKLCSVRNPESYIKRNDIYFWTKEQRCEFEKIYFDVMKNTLCMSEEQAIKSVQAFCAFGGAFNFKDLSYEYYKQYLELTEFL